MQGYEESSIESIKEHRNARLASNLKGLYAYTPGRFL